MAEKTAMAARNDKFRVSIIDNPSTIQGKLVLTAGITAQAPLVIAHILHAVKNFSEFNEGNNPYKENDFGKITLTGIDTFWKIDYYSDESMNYGTDDPLTTYQVLTIMLASEY